MIQILLGAKVFYAENLEKLISNMGTAKTNNHDSCSKILSKSFYQNKHEF